MSGLTSLQLNSCHSPTQLNWNNTQSWWYQRIFLNENFTPPQTQIKGLIPGFEVEDKADHKVPRLVQTLFKVYL